jgi:hypothetical protein
VGGGKGWWQYGWCLDVAQTVRDTSCFSWPVRRLIERVDSQGRDVGPSSERKSRSSQSWRASAKMVEVVRLLTRESSEVPKDVGAS